MKFLVVFIIFTSTLKAQIDSAMSVPLVGINLAGNLPFADMAQRFGANLKAGGSFHYKTKKNWIFGFEFGYGFGRNVKEDVLKQLKNSDGYLVDNSGYPADLRVTERLTVVHLTAGRVLKLASSNPNSGLMLSFGLGYIQHRINFYDAQYQVAGVKDNLGYGLDRLTAGFSTSQFVGYLFLSENRLLNFYAGFECYQGYTTSIRKLNYDTGLPDTRKRFDALGGFKFGWILPLYKKKPNDVYYN
jgi:hypothetical protein